MSNEETEPTLPVLRADVEALRVLVLNRIGELSRRMKGLQVGHIGRSSAAAELEVLADRAARLDELLKPAEEDDDASADVQ